MKIWISTFLQIEYKIKFNFHTRKRKYPSIFADTHALNGERNQRRWLRTIPPSLTNRQQQQSSSVQV